MKFLLDTDHLSILQRQSGSEFARLRARLARLPVDELALCIVSFHEQVLGCNAFISQARRPSDVVRGYRMFDRVLSAFAAAVVLSFDKDASVIYEDLTSRRIRIGTMDLRIASVALKHGLTLLTRNSRDFARVPGLLLDDWTV